MRNIEAIISNAGMSTRPEYYSGGGPSTTYLDSPRLARLAKGITESLTNDKVVNQKALKEFVKMVIAQKDMSPTVFLQSLYNLESNNRKFDDTVLQGTDNNDIGNDEEKRGGIAFALAASALTSTGTRTSQEVERLSNDIKHNFLSKYCRIKPIHSTTNNWLSDFTAGYTYTLKEELFEVLK